MSKYDEFDLDLQNTKINGATPDKTGYSFISCPTQPVIDCAVKISKRFCPSDNCPPNTHVTCPSGHCDDGTLVRCMQNLND